MELATEQSNWWLPLILPGIVAGIFSVAVQWLIALVFSRRMETFKNQLNADLKSYEHALDKRLEDYKNILQVNLSEQTALFQSEIQSRLYAFQTKFSVFHQRRADAVERLYDAVATVEMDLEEWLFSDGITLTITKPELYERLKSHQQEFHQTFDLKRIYFTDRLIALIQDFVEFESFVIPSRGMVNYQTSNVANDITVNIKTTMNRKSRAIGAECKSILDSTYSPT